MKRLPANAPPFSVHPAKGGYWCIRMRWARGRDGLVYVSSHKTRKEAEAEIRRMEKGGM
jgi:hypothetical protein